MARFFSLASEISSVGMPILHGDLIRARLTSANIIGEVLDH